ncbi:sulfite exporter TauE/SafE family protein (plasmid) [Pedobacter sp. BS3]|uniref:sulfite exporter TauE/SafE family protein n=1 Tax=Pedobacter sp. BS3 TaxID=2567937 RepID=UPI0011F00319|nr:sulfite exporter TauE/SafE family protein [Pedobacter sp. BS3]TZF85628.1 sulfite exporter TauE/SafE family protein [Pedobacter sp. BS3]
MTEFIVILVGFTIAGWIQGLLGFGFAVATTLMLVNRIDFTMLVFLNLCMSVLTSLIAMLSGKNLRSIHKSTLWKLMVSSLIGLLIGTAMLDLINALILKKITLLVILMASLVSLTKNKRLFAHNYMTWISGFFSGVLTPSTGINGPLVALHLNAAFTDKEPTRNTMLSYLFLIMVFGVIAMSIQGSLPAETWNTLPKVIIPSVAGYVLGMLSFRLLSHGVFKTMVTLFLIISSLSSFIYLIL